VISIAGLSGDKFACGDAHQHGASQDDSLVGRLQRRRDTSRSTTGSEIVTSTAIDSGLFPGSTTPYWANVVITDGRKKVIAGRGAIAATRSGGGVLQVARCRSVPCC
jgi:hypothetical protein